MARFRKKPVVIEAFQWPWSLIDGDPNAANHEFNSAVFHLINEPGTINSYIKTLEGDMRVMPGDWVIKGIKGEFYPCRPDIFEMTYILDEGTNG